MEIKIRNNFLGLVLVGVIFICQNSDCASLSRQEGKLLIPLQERGTCLEKLICGINVVGTKSAVKGYSNQVDLIRRYFKLYPLSEDSDSDPSTAAEADDETKVDAEISAELDDDSEELASVNDYNVELEDIVHKPKPKPSKRTKPKRKKTKNQAPKNKVIFGNTGLPISESISLTGRLIKTNRKNAKTQATPAPPQPQLRTDDEEIITQLHQKQIMERMARKLSERREARKQGCGDIVCPHTFKQLYESLQASLDSDSDSDNSPAQAPTQYSNDEESEELVKQVSALSEQNLPSQQGAYTNIGGNKNSQMNGMEGFFHATEVLQHPKQTHSTKYSSKKKKKVKKTKKPLKKTPGRPGTKTSKTAQKKAMIANHDVVGTIAPPHKVIRYRPSNTEEDLTTNDDNGDDEDDDITKTRPVKLIGHPQHDEDLKEIQKKLKQRPSVYHREEEAHDDEQGTSASDENHDDYDEEAKYEVPVDYGNDEDDDEDEDEDDDVTEEEEHEIRAKPKRVKKKAKPVIKTIVKTVANKPTNNPSIDYFDTSATIKRSKKKEQVSDDAVESSEEDLDDEGERSLNIDGVAYSHIYSRDPMNIGGRPMSPPGEIPVEMTSMMGLTHRQMSGGRQTEAQPNLLVRQQARQPSRTQSKKGKGKKKEKLESDEEPVAPPRKQLSSYASNAQQSSAYFQSSDPTEMSTGLSFSRLTAPFQSIFKLVKEGNIFQSGNGPYKQAQAHYQYNPNPRPPAAFNHLAFSSPAQNTHHEPEPEELSVVKPAPAPPPPSFNPIVLPRPVGPESSHFKRYKVEKKEPKIPGRNPVF